MKCGRIRLVPFAAMPRSAQLLLRSPIARGKLDGYFSKWGGEIHTANEQAWKEPQLQRLRTLGDSHLVTAVIDASDVEIASTGGTPGLAYTFAATALGLKTNDGLVHYLGDIPAAQIHQIAPWEPSRD